MLAIDDALERIGEAGIVRASPTGPGVNGEASPISWLRSSASAAPFSSGVIFPPIVEREKVASSRLSMSPSTSLSSGATCPRRPSSAPPSAAGRFRA
jgi:hypothetical protein